MKYRPEIDGLRAVAITPVVLFHAHVPGFGGGFVGVDVFFVLSGYLITALMLREAEAGPFSILRFYERRARRILPALFAVMLVCIPFARAWMEITEFDAFGKSVAATAAFGSNILFWLESGYFGGDAELKPLLHTWSLAVEEQFYIVYPLLFILLWRRAQAQAVWILLGLALLSLAGAEWGWRHAPEGNFYLFPSRGWELLAGAICALVQARRGARAHGGLAALGLAMILGAIFLYDQDTPFPSLLAVPPVLGTALVVAFGAPSTAVGRALSMKIPVRIGLISYSTYLVHQPLLAFARIISLSEPGLPLMLALAALSFPLGWLSWRFVERPFRRHGPGAVLPGRRILVASAVGLAGFFAAGAAIHAWPRALSPLQTDALRVERAEARAEAWRTVERNPALRAEYAVFPPADPARPRLNVLVTGDSHSMDLLNALHLNRDALPGFAFRRQEINGDCYEARDLFGREVNATADCVAAFLRDGGARVAEADWILLSVRWSLRRYLAPRLEDMVRGLQAAGLRVAIAGAAPEFHDSTKFMRRLHDELGDVLARPEIAKPEIDRRFTASLDPGLAALNDRLRAIAARTGAVWLDKFDYSCAGTPPVCDAVSADLRPLRYDEDHATRLGAALFGARIAAQGWLDPLADAALSAH